MRAGKKNSSFRESAMITKTERVEGYSEGRDHWSWAARKVSQYSSEEAGVCSLGKKSKAGWMESVVPVVKIFGGESEV